MRIGSVINDLAGWPGDCGLGNLARTTGGG